jgi:AsmA protein
MKIFKRILIAAAILLLLLVAGAGILLASFDPNSYKSEIEQIVLDRTGRELRLEGDIGLSLFPNIGLDLGKAELGNAPGFGDDPFARVNTVRLNVALMPLLKSKVQVDTIVLDGLQLDLERNQQGVTNWDDLVQEQDKEAAAPSPEKETPASTEGAAPPISDVQVQGLKIINARLSFKDAQKGSDLKLDPFNLETGRLVLGQPMPLNMDLHLIQAPDTDLVATLEAMITLNPAQERYDLSDLQLEATVKQSDLPAGEVTLELSADLKADLKAQTATLEQLLVKVLGLSAKGGLTAEKIIDAPSYTGNFKVERFNPRTLLQQLGTEVPATADPGVLKQAELGFQISGTDDRIQLAGLNLSLDDSTMNGTASVANFEKPAIRVDLALDGINLDRYSAPESAASKGGAVPGGSTAGGSATGGGASDDDLGIPSEQLRELDAILNFKVGQLIMQKATLTDAVVGITAQKGVVRIDPFRASLYGGSFNTQVTMDVRGKTPKFTISERLKGVQSAPLLKDMYGDSYLSGNANMEASLTTSGNQVSALKRNLNGKMSLAFKEGSINDSKLAEQLNKVTAIIEKRQYDPAQKSTNFSSLTASATIKKGLIENKDMHLKAPKFQVKGLGTASLVTEKVDYQLRLMKPSQDPNAKQIYAPIDVTGTLDNLSYRFNEKEYANQLLEREKKKVEKKAREKVDKEVDKAKEDIGKEVDKALKGLFGR